GRDRFPARTGTVLEAHLASRSDGPPGDPAGGARRQLFPGIRTGDETAVEDMRRRRALGQSHDFPAPVIDERAFSLQADGAAAIGLLVLAVVRAQADVPELEYGGSVHHVDGAVGSADDDFHPVPLGASRDMGKAL